MNAAGWRPHRRVRSIQMLLHAAFALSGCDAAQTTGLDVDDILPSEGNTFSGLVGLRWFDTATTSLERTDLTAWRIEARLVGSSEVRAGFGRPDGTFVIPISQGVRQVCLSPAADSPAGPLVVVTELDSVDLVTHVQGRPQAASGPGTVLAVEGRLKQRWNHQLSIRMFGGFLSRRRDFSQTMSPRSDHFGPIEFDWSDEPLLRATPGDDVLIGVWDNSSGPEGSESQLVEVAMIERAEMQAAVVNPRATMALDLRRKDVEIAYDASSWSDPRPFHPRARGLVIHVGVAITPGLLHVADPGRDENFLWSLYNAHAAEGRLVRTISDPPPGWGAYSFLRVASIVDFPPSPMTFGVGASFVEAAQTPLRPLVARLDPPRRVRVGGRRADIELTGVGSSPAIEWDPPTAAPIDGYKVKVTSLATGVASAGWTIAPKFEVPSSWLHAGTRYVVSVTAYQREGEAVVRRPLQRSPSEARATVLSEPFTP